MSDKKVTVYSTPTCPYCRMAKDYLTKKKVDFTDYDVASDKEKAQEMVKKSGQMGVPVIFVDDKMVIGFNQAELDKLLAA